MEMAPLPNWTVLLAIAFPVTAFAHQKALQDEPMVGGGMMGMEVSAEQLEFFERRIRPILVTKCGSCHSADADRLRGGLKMDSRTMLLEGGDTGAAIVPGDPDASLLIQAVRYTDQDLQMPPRQKLSDEEIADLERWVQMGAPDPRESASGQLVEMAPMEVDVEKGRSFWSFVAPTKPEPPEVKDSKWCHSDIDRFLLAKMEERHLDPVADADRRTLIRRASFDLIGLPPTPEQVDAFVKDRSPGAYERLLDRLLASPQFGERWGRHWLDVARYAESSGKDRNIIYPHAWRYRDWVIEAVNADMPYDEFLIQQLAGDLLSADDPTDRAKQQIATGFLAIGPKSHNAMGKAQFAVELVDEQIDATGQAMLGLTIACARCHDHKFDPIPTQDYYAMAGIFMSSETCFGTNLGNQNRHTADLIELPEGAVVPNGARMAAPVRAFIDGALARARETAGLDMDGASSAERAGAKAGATAQQTAFQVRQARATVDSLTELLSRYGDDGTPKASNRLAMGMRESRTGNAQVLVRGELDKRGDVVPRGFVQVLVNEETPVISAGSGRLELAQWITAQTNPLTARVAVNRIWLHLMGRAIVPTPDNFGASGLPPSHPELLDWLAVTFMDEGWSTKRLIKRLMMTHAYQLASRTDGENARSDPLAEFYWRMPDRRLEGEAIRDAMLACAGTLDTEPALGSPVGALEGGTQAGRDGLLSQYLATDTQKRSVYLPIIRDMLPEPLDTFDFAQPAFVTSNRAETNVPSQALYLMNDARVAGIARQMADRLLSECDSDTERVERGFELALGRQPTSSERTAARNFLKEFARVEAEQADDMADLARRGWTGYCQALFQSAEFRYLD